MTERSVKANSGSQEPLRVLVVEDRQSLRSMLERALESEGHRVETAADGAAGIERVRGGGFDLVLTDLKLPHASGLDVVRAVREADARTPVIVMTGYGTVATAVEAMKSGAFDFIEKPVELDELFALVETAVRDRRGGNLTIFEVEGAPPIVGRHPLLRTALRLLERVATTDSTVLLTGESGTGKELFAKALHGLSGRSSRPFVALNCAAIPETLIENELFGHERGAFTGADRRQIGRFEAASTGTLFLDEIGELPLTVQGKVLRVLEERTFERVGGSQTLVADVRLVAATNRDLASMVEAGIFRSDLFFRLDVFPIDLPALRERAGDVPDLARFLIGRIADQHRLELPTIQDEALDWLKDLPWPGNIRELSNVLERAVILCDGGELSREDLEAVARPLLSSKDSASSGAWLGGGEREAIKQALDETAGDKPRAADRLGISYRTLQRRIRRHGLEGYPQYSDP